jgi:hypothetical protein
LPATAFPLSYAFLGKAQSTDVAILKETAKTKSQFLGIKCALISLALTQFAEKDIKALYANVSP